MTEPLVEWNSKNLTDEQKTQVINWIWSTRQGAANAAWFVNTVKENHTITNSNRGEFHGDKWIPIEKERQPCCEPLIKVMTEEPPSCYSLIEHCQTKEHVENLIRSLTAREIRKEFNRMLKATAKAIEDSFV